VGHSENGWLVQHVIFVGWVIKIDNHGKEVVERIFHEYWEAWQVRSGRVLKPHSPDKSGQDTFVIPDYRDLTGPHQGGTKTKGQIMVIGKMEYFRGSVSDIEKHRNGWGIGGSSHAGELMSTEQKPAWWTDQGATRHFLWVWWDGISAKKIPTTLYTTPTAPPPISKYRK
jgi:hypothetical protein